MTQIKATRSGTRVVTGKVRLSYAHVWDPQSVNGSDPKYSVSLIIEPDDKDTIEAINAAVEEAIRDSGPKFKGKIPPKSSLRLPLQDGDEKHGNDPAYEGMLCLNANSKQAPGIVDQACRPIIDRSELYSGCYARVSLNFFAYNVTGNKGIAAGLGNIQKISDGEPLGGGSTPEQDFEALDGFEEAVDDDFLA